MINFLLALLALSLLIFIHELGHFVVGKLSGAQVEEFGFGYPPRLVGKKIGETIYSFNLIPFGGFTKFLRGSDSPDSFEALSWQKRAGILIAGVVANFVLGWLVLTILFSIGNPLFEGRVVATKVPESSPAAGGGLQVGDVFVSLNGKEVSSWVDLNLRLRGNLGKEVELYVCEQTEWENNSENCGRSVVVSLPEEVPAGQGPLGITTSAVGEEKIVKVPFWQAPKMAFKESILLMNSMFSGISLMVRRLLFEGQVPRELSGTVGAFQAVKEASQLGFRYLLQMVALLSLNLSLFNLFPIPALDGGQLLFLGVEAFSGQKVSPKIKEWVNFVGMGMLLLLMILVTIRDIRRLVS
ncbi:MAG: M50 family metallopeptidase [Patescibacteria group bacterium]